MPNLYNIYQIDQRSHFSSETTWHQQGIKRQFIIYTLGGGVGGWVGDSYVIYNNLEAPPPLDDVNVEDPPINTEKPIHPPVCMNVLIL